MPLYRGRGTNDLMQMTSVADLGIFVRVRSPTQGLQDLPVSGLMLPAEAWRAETHQLVCRFQDGSQAGGSGEREGLGEW